MHHDTPPRICFLDTETTSVRPDRRAWEIGLIVRTPAGHEHEHHWFIDTVDLDLGNADIRALNVGRFYDRHPQITYPHDDEARQAVWSESEALEQVEEITRGAVVVGIVPDFDAHVLAERMRWHGMCPAWRYHLVDAVTLAAGALAVAPPWDTDTILATFGVRSRPEERHTALGDARLARDLYDAALAPGGPARPKPPSRAGDGPIPVLGWCPPERRTHPTGIEEPTP